MLTNGSFVFPDNTPVTKEGYYYRTIFEKFFPKVIAALPEMETLSSLLQGDMVDVNLKPSPISSQEEQQQQSSEI